VVKNICNFDQRDDTSYKAQCHFDVTLQHYNKTTQAAFKYNENRNTVVIEFTDCESTRFSIIIITVANAY